MVTDVNQVIKNQKTLSNYNSKVYHESMVSLNINSMEQVWLLNPPLFCRVFCNKHPDGYRISRRMESRLIFQEFPNKLLIFQIADPSKMC